mmetsp:Transcript_11994/g.22135  ORF Transcript_11994/g.22135 Transcript_11994/m.22135 type:complete len:82 (+) Transcript_11994:442-687(+)
MSSFAHGSWLGIVSARIQPFGFFIKHSIHKLFSHSHGTLQLVRFPANYLQTCKISSRYSYTQAPNGHLHIYFICTFSVTDS